MAMLGYHSRGFTSTSWVEDSLNILLCIVYCPPPHRNENDLAPSVTGAKVESSRP